MRKPRTWLMPPCDAKTILTPGPKYFFRFPSPDPVTQDVDYSAQRIVVETASGKHILSHGAGVHWSSGQPSDDDITQSREYKETVRMVDNKAVTEARGVTANGIYWRLIGIFGETASYSTRDKDAAAKLDAVMDSVCHSTL